MVVTKQVGKAEYGQKRLDVTIQQIEFPGKLGVVWSVKGDVGDEKGARGVTGPVNNHVFSLLGAVAINAVLSLGTNAIAGTPTGFYQNPAQQAARETSQSASGDIRKITDAQLKVPPTIEPPKGTICTIHLSENVTFSKNPTLVR
jgi:type IV secretory pathway VirB10-like protein